MGLSFGCSKCWETPCQCGWEYKDKPPEQMADLISSILQYRTKEEARAILFRAAAIVNDETPRWSGPDVKPK